MNKKKILAILIISILALFLIIIVCLILFLKNIISKSDLFESLSLIIASAFPTIAFIFSIYNNKVTEEKLIESYNPEFAVLIDRFDEKKLNNEKLQNIDDSILGHICLINKDELENYVDMYNLIRNKFEWDVFERNISSLQPFSKYFIKFVNLNNNLTYIKQIEFNSSSMVFIDTFDVYDGKFVNKDDLIKITTDLKYSDSYNFFWSEQEKYKRCQIYYQKVSAKFDHTIYNSIYNNLNIIDNKELFFPFYILKLNKKIKDTNRHSEKIIIKITYYNKFGTEFVDTFNIDIDSTYIPQPNPIIFKVNNKKNN